MNNFFSKHNHRRSYKPMPHWTDDELAKIKKLTISRAFQPDDNWRAPRGFWPKLISNLRAWCRRRRGSHG